MELYADEKDIQSIIESLNFLLNINGYINIDFMDIRMMAENNSAYFANFIKIKGITENINHSHSDCVKGVIFDIKTSTTIDKDSLSKFMGNIEKSYENVKVIFGIRFDDTLKGNEIAASVIELSIRV